MFLKNTKFHRGTTFMELIVVIAIIGIMSSVGFAVWQSTKRDSYLRDAQHEVASAIKAAQSYAVQGRVKDGGVPCGFGFHFLDDYAYEIFYTTGDCSAGFSSLSLHNMETFNLNKGVRLSAPVQDIYFDVPFGEMVPKMNIDFGFEYAGKIKTITVSSGGSVTEN